jgi:hypothetical protein
VESLPGAQSKGERHAGPAKNNDVIERDSAELTLIPWRAKLHGYPLRRRRREAGIVGRSGPVSRISLK